MALRAVGSLDMLRLLLSVWMIAEFSADRHLAQTDKHEQIFDIFAGAKRIE